MEKLVTGTHSRKDDEGVRMAVSAGLGRSSLDFKELEGRINSLLPNQWASLEYWQSPLPSSTFLFLHVRTLVL